MINYINYDRLVELFARIFHYGFINEYHPKAIENRVINSRLIDFLEINKDFYLDEKNDDEIISEIYSLNTEKEIDVNFSDLALWTANSYLNLFFEFKKSFSFLFLYIPIEEMVEKYDVYHEMDISQLFAYFTQKINEKTLLSTLLKEKKITTKQLSVLSGISINTLNGYCKNDEIIFGGSFEYISLISQILNVKPNIFLKKLYISLNSYLLSKNETEQYVKDAYEFFNTKEIGEKYQYVNNKKALKGKTQSINMIIDHDERYTYDSLIKLINEYIDSYNKTIVYKESIIDSIDNPKVAVVSKDIYMDNGKKKTIPSIVKEYALIKANESLFS